MHVGRHFHGLGADFVEGRALILAVDHVLAGVQRGRVIVVGGVVLNLQPVAMLEVAVGHEFIGRRYGESPSHSGNGGSLSGGPM